MPNYLLDLPLAPHDLTLEEIAFVNSTKDRFVKLLAIGRTGDALVVLGRSSKFLDRFSYASQGVTGLIPIGASAAEPYANIIDDNLKAIDKAVAGMRVYQSSLADIRRATGASVTLMGERHPGQPIVASGHSYVRRLWHNSIPEQRAQIHADTALLLTALDLGANAIAHYTRAWKDKNTLEVIGTPVLIADRRK